MTWLKRISAILGRFWTTLFEDSDFILGIQNLYALVGRLYEAAHDNWVNGLTPAVEYVKQDGYPFLIMIDVDSVHETLYSFEEVLTDLKDTTSEEDKKFGLPKPGAGWTAVCSETIAYPDILTEHAAGMGRMLFAGLDYTYNNKTFVFYEDPRTMGFPVIKTTDKDGKLKLYIRLFGRTLRKVNDYDQITGFGSKELNEYADICWDIHQNGATVYNTKKLLGGVTGSVIADEDGTVADKWTENGWTFLLINNKVYGSEAVSNVEKGADIKTGTVLFGSLKMSTSADAAADDDIPGIMVQTDAGELLAENKYLDPVIDQESGVTILPLSTDSIAGGAANRITEYNSICIRNAKDINCPQVTIPLTEVTDDDTGIKYNKVNPYLFVMNTLRRGRAVCVHLVATNVRKLGAALQWLRKCTSMSGTVTVFVQAESDNLSLPISGFVSYAGMTAIAVGATITIKNACAEARVML